MKSKDDQKKIYEQKWVFGLVLIIAYQFIRVS